MSRIRTTRAARLIRAGILTGRWAMSREPGIVTSYDGNSRLFERAYLRTKVRLALRRRLPLPDTPVLRAIARALRDAVSEGRL
jgi:hypothetical protein